MTTINSRQVDWRNYFYALEFLEEFMKQAYDTS